MKQISLNGKWKLFYYDAEQIQPSSPSELIGINCIDCSVPGNTELDLSAAGLLPSDLYMGENILEVEKYETYGWWYRTEFSSPKVQPGERVFLNFEGVDCFAEYWLNGEKIGESSNALIPVELNITHLLKPTNTLYVHIKSALLEAHGRDYPSSSMIYQFFHEAVRMRKPAHSIGWDIMPRALTAGLWRDVNLTVRSVYEFSQFFGHIRRLEKHTAHLIFTYELDCPVIHRLENFHMKITGRCGDSVFKTDVPVTFKAGRAECFAKEPKLWYPYGYGEPNLYEVTAVFFKDDEELCSFSYNMGLRTVELIRSDTTDGENGCFKFVINGTEVMCKGSNWVPMDAFHSRDVQRLPKALELVRDIGCNMLRCWGGNVYEHDIFYDFCDKNGIMIWQDFAMACFPYPQDKEMCEALEPEITAVVRRLRNHPSIVLWAGDNECDESIVEFDPNTNILTRQIIPNVIKMNDLQRPYLPSSPYISPSAFRKNRYKILPENHIWGPRDYFKSRFYTEFNAHFVSEAGYHGCPSLSSIKKFITPGKIWPYTDNNEWLVHATHSRGGYCEYRIPLMEKQIKQLFGAVPDNIDDFIFASQASQAEAKKFFIENIRGGKPVKSGILWWNLLDGWPQFSDAVVDYFYDKKMAYDYIKRSQQPFCIIVSEIENWNVNVIASNDTLSCIKGSYTVNDGETGEILLEGSLGLKENENEILGQIPVMYSDKRLLTIFWEANGKRGFNHYVCGMPAFDLNRYKKWHGIIKTSAAAVYGK